MSERTAPNFAFDVGSAVKPCPGEVVSGDVVVSAATRRGQLVALIDGLGHGAGAADVATRAADAFRGHAELPLPELFAVVHRELRGTRGAAASAASFDATSECFEFAGIGNVAARVLTETEAGNDRVTPLVRPGVLGSAFRSVASQRVPFREGDMLLLYSDGVRSRFDLLALRLLDAHAAAEDVLASASRDNDDASCVVVRAIAPTLERVAASSVPGTPERRIPIRVPGDAHVAAVETRRVAADIGMPGRSQWEAGIAAAELASNVLKYGREGVLTLRVTRADASELVIEVSDRGLGLSPDAAQSAREQPFSSRNGLGVGLESVRRLMDDLEIQSFPKRGTRLIARKRFKR